MLITRRDRNGNVASRAKLSGYLHSFTSIKSHQEHADTLVKWEIWTVIHSCKDGSLRRNQMLVKWRNGWSAPTQSRVKYETMEIKQKRLDRVFTRCVRVDKKSAVSIKRSALLQLKYTQTYTLSEVIKMSLLSINREAMKCVERPERTATTTTVFAGATVYYNILQQPQIKQSNNNFWYNTTESCSAVVYSVASSQAAKKPMTTTQIPKKYQQRWKNTRKQQQQ